MGPQHPPHLCVRRGAALIVQRIPAQAHASRSSPPLLLLPLLLLPLMTMMALAWFQPGLPAGLPTLGLTVALTQVLCLEAWGAGWAGGVGAAAEPPDHPFSRGVQSRH